MESVSVALKNAPEHVRELLRSRLPEHYVFHSYEHTEHIVNSCIEIGRESGMKKKDLEIALIACWFQDAGYVSSDEGHEEVSVQLVTEYLQSHGVPDETIARVTECILATRIPQSPQKFVEEVVCDAVVLFTGQKKFFRALDLLRVEREKVNGKTFSEAEWLQKSTALLLDMPFRTDYAKTQYGARRKNRLVKLQERLRAEQEQVVNQESKRELKKGILDSKLERQRRPDRGIETMFRVVPRTHIELSSIADQKANILISINAIIISIVVTLLIRELDQIGWLVLPTLILLFVCLVTIVFATLATKPKITAGTFAREDIIQKKANLLFFGNFYRMPFEDFSWGMKEMMGDREYLYGSMIKDLYSLGQVLGRKYRYLSVSYNVFMYGIIIAVIAFALALFSVPEGTGY